MKAVSIVLPWPPSSNRLWRSPNKGPLRGRHLLSRTARAYKTQAGMIIAAQPEEFPVPIPGRVAVRLRVYPPDRRKRDLDNVIKIVLDSCKGQCFDDDANIDHLEVLRAEVVPPGYIEISIWPLEGG